MPPFNQKHGKKFRGIDPEAKKVLQEYSWPGNVRELRNTVERIILLESGTTLLPHHLTFRQAEQAGRAPSGQEQSEKILNYEETIKKLIREALGKTGGNVLETARLLDMPAHKLRYRIKKYGLSSG